MLNNGGIVRIARSGRHPLLTLTGYRRRADFGTIRTFVILRLVAENDSFEAFTYNQRA